MSATCDKLRRKVDELPRRPGVYLMKSARNEVLYVGKAKDLRARVRSYFQEGGDDWRLISKSIDQVADVDVVVTRSEAEALLMENNFIKQFRPRYNVFLRDDKSFVSIEINLNEPWPRPVVTRRLDDAGALYFGPYASSKGARRMLRVLRDVFPLRRCSLRECRERKRPCLYGEMGKCSAPCCDNVTEEEYRALVLRSQMERAAGQMQFERAATLRDRIQAIETTLEAQHVASSADKVDRDVFGMCTVEQHVSVAVLFMRNGNVLDAASYRFPADLDSQEAIFSSFLSQFYSANRFVPSEVLVPVSTPDADLVASWLSEKKGRKVRVIRPQRGAKRRMVEMANGNALQAEQASATEDQKRRLEMESLQRILGLDELPENIECFDISTLQGREAVGSMVVFRRGVADKSSYRHYRIRQVAGQDDFAMMREVLTRRYGKAGAGGMPELVLVDGGKGQLGVALEVLGELGLDACEVAALAKARSADGRQVRSERVYLPGQAEPIILPESSYGIRLIVRVRDEAHRFAVSYHRKLRRKAAMASPLQEVRGVGRKTAQRLMEHFGGLNKIREATVEELKAVPGVSDTLAAALHDYWRQEA